MKLNTALRLLIAIGVCEAAGIVGALFTTPSISTWYTTLTKPALNPPAWIFAPVWTTLYLLMGIAAFLIWQKGLKKKEVKTALLIFIGQLLLNGLWTILFFGFHQIFFALIEIVLLWCAILASIVTFSKLSRSAAYLLVPYLLWVTFATYLNAAFWILNK